MTEQIRGMNKLLAQLKAIENATYVPALEKGVRQEILPTMQALTPVDTGDLLHSEKVYREGDRVVLEADSDHAVYVEFGTVNMSAEPYMRPALDEKSDAALRVMADEVNQIMKEQV